AFDYENIEVTEFGLGLDVQGRGFVQVPVDEKVQSSLVEMAKETQRAMSKKSESPQQYEPSEKYAAIEYLNLPLDDDLVAELKILHDAVNLPEDTNAFAQMEECFAYFAKITDSNGSRITAVRR